VVRDWRAALDLQAVCDSSRLAEPAHAERLGGSRLESRRPFRYRTIGLSEAPAWPFRKGDVLTEFSAYHEWNPYRRSKELQVGTKLTVCVTRARDTRSVSGASGPLADTSHGIDHPKAKADPRATRRPNSKRFRHAPCSVGPQRSRGATHAEPPRPSALSRSAVGEISGPEWLMLACVPEEMLAWLEDGCLQVRSLPRPWERRARGPSAQARASYLRTPRRVLRASLRCASPRLKASSPSHPVPFKVRSAAQAAH